MAFQEGSGRRSEVWLALFPADARPEGGGGAQIAAVLSTTHAPDAAALRALLAGGRVTGVCSKAPQSGWGATLGPEILKANPGCRLDAAWNLDVIGDPPRPEDLRLTFAGAAACFAVVVVIGAASSWSSDSSGASEVVT